jgi:hypothetical protein
MFILYTSVIRGLSPICGPELGLGLVTQGDPSVESELVFHPFGGRLEEGLGIHTHFP